ncbi:MAG TPA: hypothetical protein EYP04_03800 [Anaerolineae bacterium]|nr:hypothetical protein [Anaerolineae bacterium]HIQ05781.1 hypothetical protein [Anaerolineae bacterium]
MNPAIVSIIFRLCLLLTVLVAGAAVYSGASLSGVVLRAGLTLALSGIFSWVVCLLFLPHSTAPNTAQSEAGKERHVDTPSEPGEELTGAALLEALEQA